MSVYEVRMVNRMLWLQDYVGIQNSIRRTGFHVELRTDGRTDESDVLT